MKPSASPVALPAVAVAVCALLTGCGAAAPAGSPADTSRSNAATSCAVTASLPATTAITSRSTPVATTLRDSPDGCARHVRFDVLKDGLFLTSARSATGSDTSWPLTAADGPGVYTARFAWGYGRDYVPVAGGDSAAMTVKYGATLSDWQGDRSRRAKTVRLSVRVDDYDADGAGPGDGRTVVFQQRKNSIWRSVAKDRADAKGVAAVRIRSSKPGVWRAVLQGDDDSWGATSDPYRE